MRIFITGATGLLGRRLVADRLRRGDKVVLLSRDGAQAKAVFADGLAGVPEVVEGDPSVPGGWCAALDGCDAVVHLAGQPVAGRRWSPAYKRLLRDSRVNSTRCVVEAIARCRHQPGALLCASATGIYADTGDRPTDESGPVGCDFLAEVCAAWEAEAERAASEGVRVVALRTGIVLDDRGGALRKMTPPFAMFVGGPLGSGRQYVPWIHWGDAIGIIDLGLSNDEVSGAVNATGPEPVTNRRFSRALGAAMGRPAWLPAPGFALRLAVGELAGNLLMSHRVIPGAAARYGYEFRYPEVEPALRDLLGRARPRH